jgi:hypothetical protein
MKTVFNNSEICHVYAKQSQNEGRAGSIFFHKTKIYSYGHHFCMGNVIGPGRIILTDRSYSNTTHRHQSKLEYAINHFERAYLPYPEYRAFNSDNVKVFNNRFNDLFLIIGNKRKKETTKQNALSDIKRLINNIELSAQWTNDKLKQTSPENRKLAQFIKAGKNATDLLVLSEKIAENKRKETEKQKADRAKKVKAWLKGENTEIWFYDSVLLRLITEDDQNFVQTSKGAKVSERSAKLLYSLIKAGKDIKGHNIDGYTVIGINGVLSIGCHKIDTKEVSRFAKLMKW